MNYSIGIKGDLVDYTIFPDRLIIVVKDKHGDEHELHMSCTYSQYNQVAQKTIELMGQPVETLVSKFSNNWSETKWFCGYAISS